MMVIIEQFNFSRKIYAVLVSILLLSLDIYCQTAEEVALQFFANELLPKEERARVRFNGLVTPITAEYSESSNSVVELFYYCKLKSRKSYSDQFKQRLSFSNWPPPGDFEYQSMPSDGAPDTINVPPPIRYVDTPEYSNLNEVSKISLKSTWAKIFGHKYNLEVDPAVQYADYSFIWIKKNKTDLEFGDNYYIVVNSSKNVVDFCHTYWIQ